ncbi:hypothetical protein [Amycolatopsis plumensis]|uniref:hypothetical protein n=1 Tax=Amycolatopsis plumensis TaxID=236508 RepID=UPI003620A288
MSSRIRRKPRSSPHRLAFAVFYVMVLTVQNGLITHSRDYTDTAAAAERLKAWSPAGSTAG